MTSFLNRSGARTAALCFALALSSSALACDDGTDDDMGDADTTGDTTGGDGDGDSGALSHAGDIQPIWDDNCVTGCHMPGGVAATLDLSDDAFDDLVGSPSSQAGGASFVAAGSAMDSYVVAKLRGTQMEFGGAGGPMPSGSGALPEATLVMIEQWIDEGALP